MVETTTALPPAASAEGESAALQGRVVEASALDNDNLAEAVGKSDGASTKLKKDAGLRNYFVGRMLVLTQY